MIATNHLANWAPNTDWRACLYSRSVAMTSKPNIALTKKIISLTFYTISYTIVFFEFKHKSSWNLPTYWAKNLLSFKFVIVATIGDDSPDIINGPIKVLGTTPGNSWWSYYRVKKTVLTFTEKENFHFYFFYYWVKHRCKVNQKISSWKVTKYFY